MIVPPNTAKAILIGLCPRCGQGPLFHGYIAVQKHCPACGLDYSIFDPGDGPAVFGILIVGAIVCGLALWVEFTFQPPLWVHALLWVPLIVFLTAIFLRLSKSALLVLQYKHKAGEGRLD
ncbi:MAG: DUF983 domain-containing protein [Alphaproteobacteria bacterium]|nr:DUF983 domain-containing protein [Alphaproteobacteria bacterium]